MQHAAQPVLLFFNLFCERKGDVKVSVSTKYKFSLTEKTIKLPQRVYFTKVRCK